MTDTDDAILRQKRIKLGAIAVTGLLVGIAYILNDNTGTTYQQAKPEIHDLKKDIDPNNLYWELEQKIKRQDASLNNINNQLKENSAELSIFEQLETQNAQNKQLMARIEALEKANIPVINPQQIYNPQQSRSKSVNTQHLVDYGKDEENDEINEDYKILQEQKQLKTHRFESIKKGTESNPATMYNTIPSNSFVRAVLQNGVDVSASQSSQQNPKPVVMAVTDWVNLPNKHKIKTLKFCRIHATAWGDLSSERVYMAPDLLTCISPNGEIVETSLRGFIAGEDGKAGIRGHMITRDDALVRSAIVAGTISGLGNSIANTRGTTSVSALGSTRTLDTTDILKSDIGKGVGNGLEMVAKYKIAQAENLQPIIQINANRPVDVMFFSSSRIGEIDNNTIEVPQVETPINSVLSALNSLPGVENE